MGDPFNQILHDWQTFYGLLGTAAATLIGLQFVAASLGASFVKPDTTEDIDTWVTPTIFHFGAVLAIAALISVPYLDSQSFGIVLGLGSLVGLANIYRVGRLMKRHRPNPAELNDLLWHVVLPVVSYLLALGTAIMVAANLAVSLNDVALASMILLIVGIRNAWDLAVWIVQNRKN